MTYESSITDISVVLSSQNDIVGLRPGRKEVLKKEKPGSLFKPGYWVDFSVYIKNDSRMILFV